MKINVRPTADGFLIFADGCFRIQVLDQLYGDRDFTIETNHGPIKRSQLFWRGMVPLPFTPSEERYRREVLECHKIQLVDFKRKVESIRQNWLDHGPDSDHAMFQIEQAIIQFDINMAVREAYIAERVLS